MALTVTVTPAQRDRCAGAGARRFIKMGYREESIKIKRVDLPVRLT